MMNNAATPMTLIAEAHTRGITVITSYDPLPIPTRNCDWSAVTDDYDGAEDSKTRSQIGWGATESAAIADLLEQIEEDVA